MLCPATFGQAAQQRLIGRLQKRTLSAFQVRMPMSTPTPLSITDCCLLIAMPTICAFVNETQNWHQPRPVLGTPIAKTWCVCVAIGDSIQ